MAIIYAKTKKAKYAARTNYLNKMHISVPADRIVTGWLDMCYTMHYPELLSSLKYYEIIYHYKVTNRDKIEAFCICWTELHTHKHSYTNVYNYTGNKISSFTPQYAVQN